MAKLVFLGRLADLAGVPERAVEPGPLETILTGLPVELADREQKRWLIGCEGVVQWNAGSDRVV